MNPIVKQIFDALLRHVENSASNISAEDIAGVFSANTDVLDGKAVLGWRKKVEEELIKIRTELVAHRTSFEAIAKAQLLISKLPASADSTIDEQLMGEVTAFIDVLNSGGSNASSSIA